MKIKSKTDPWDSYRKATLAQKQQRDRSWRIFRLRGLQSQITMLTEGRAERAIAIIDEELASIGAMTKEEKYQHDVEQIKGDIET